jgi:hypothetical protein
MRIERSFAHIVDAGGMRRTTLRGWENLNKRFKLAAAFYNLSQLMRKLFGFGTPKQLAAAMERSGRGLFFALARLFMNLLARVDVIASAVIPNRRIPRNFSYGVAEFDSIENAITSTGC